MGAEIRGFELIFTLKVDTKPTILVRIVNYG